MTLSRDVINDRFAKDVRTILAAARAEGMTDGDIQEKTGITFGTFHRWASGKRIGPDGPKPAKVRQFYERMGFSWPRARDLLGLSADDEPPAPEPVLEVPPHFREVLRRLRDPNVSDEEKFNIRETMRYLATRPKPPTGAARR